MHYFYKASIPSGHSYIGYTGRSIAERWNDHLFDARRGRDYYLHRAIRKYGEGCWTVEELHHEICSNAEACIIERRLIALHNTFTSRLGLNMTVGGDGGNVNAKKTPVEKAAIAAKTKATKLERYGTLGWTPAMYEARRNMLPEARERSRNKKSEWMQSHATEHGARVRAGHQRRSLEEKSETGNCISAKIKAAYAKRKGQADWDQYIIALSKRVSKPVHTPMGRFESLQEAVTGTGIPNTTLRRKIKSNEHPDFFYV